jgi:hypothetical protein
MNYTMKRLFAFIYFPIFCIAMLTFSSCEEHGDDDWGSGGGNNNSTYYRLSISPTSVELPAKSGSFTIRVKSNQAWSVSINNSGNDPIPGLQLSKYSGNGNDAITVFYDKPKKQYYVQIASIIVVGAENGTEVCDCWRACYP